jgi:hypothetical protein
MNKKLVPAIGIIVVTIILLLVNEFTDTTFIKDYAYLFIIAGMLLGVALTNLANKSKNKE